MTLRVYVAIVVGLVLAPAAHAGGDRPADGEIRAWVNALYAEPPVPSVRERSWSKALRSLGPVLSGAPIDPRLEARIAELAARRPIVFHWFDICRGGAFIQPWPFDDVARSILEGKGRRAENRGRAHLVETDDRHLFPPDVETSLRALQGSGLVRGLARELSALDEESYQENLVLLALGADHPHVPGIREAATALLLAMPDRGVRAVARDYHTLKHAPDSWQRRAVAFLGDAYALERSEHVVHSLVVYADAENEAVWRAVLDRLAELAPPGAAPLIAWGIRGGGDKSDAYQVAVLETLGTLGDEGALTIVRERFDHGSPEVREAARGALARIEGKQSREAKPAPGG